MIDVSIRVPSLPLDRCLHTVSGLVVARRGIVTFTPVSEVISDGAWYSNPYGERCKVIGALAVPWRFLTYWTLEPYWWAHGAKQYHLERSLEFPLLRLFQGCSVAFAVITRMFPCRWLS